MKIAAMLGWLNSTGKPRRPRGFVSSGKNITAAQIWSSADCPATWSGSQKKSSRPDGGNPSSPPAAWISAKSIWCDEAQGPGALSVFLEIRDRKRRPPRPGHIGGEVGHAAEAARADRGVCALFKGTGFEDHRVPRGGCQARRPFSQPSLSERSFQLFAC